MKTPFTPEPLPLKGIEWADLIEPVSEATSALARYDALLRGIPSPSLLLSPLMTEEAVISSRIEGTIATAMEVLRFDAEPQPMPKEHKADEKILRRREAVKEVSNYRKAMLLAVGELEKRPLCLNLIKNMHGVLLEGVRGRDKGRGLFRREQNYIGKYGTPIEQAIYVPPEPLKVDECMSNLETYCHYEERNRLVQVSVIHAQFELIHPFSDGNGRIGRILVPVFLYSTGVLKNPTYYISAYLEATRDEYYGRLLAVSESNDWMGWIKYFLRAMAIQAEDSCKKVDRIQSLYSAKKDQLLELTRSRFAIRALDCIFNYPVFNAGLFASESKIPRRSALRVLKELVRGGVIEKVREKSGRRSALYVFSELLDIVSN
ncbi:MAG: Fic family protein [Candidatus Eisenbacteria bacterium]|nr:Fic family protein [Candidatus Eisenbacteria bacterium]